MFSRFIFGCFTAAILMAGCPTQSAVPAPDLGAALDSNAALASPGADPQLTRSVIEPIAHDLALSRQPTVVSVADTSPINIEPNAQSSTSNSPSLALYSGPPDSSGSPNSTAGAPADVPFPSNSFHAYLDAIGHEEVLAASGDLPDGSDAFTARRVAVALRMQGNVPTSYTIPGYMVNGDALAPLSTVGVTTTIGGELWLADITTPGWYRLHVTLDVLQRTDGALHASAHFTLTGGCLAMSLSGSGTHTFDATWDDNTMEYASDTTYLVHLSAGPTDQTTATSDTRLTIQVAGTLTK